MRGSHKVIVWDAAAIVLLACTAAMVLAVPVFPTQDGPVHLYYVDVLRDLLKHSGPLTQYFEIKSWVTPYALEYYSLLLLETAFSPTTSEKLLICGYIFSFMLSFRYLVGSVSKQSSPWILVGIPFWMNSLVYMGFLNYCMGVALALFLSGFWIRYGMRLRARRIVELLVCFTLALVIHPVPVAVFLLFAGVHIGMDLILAVSGASRSWATSLRERRRPLVILVLMGGAAAIWVSRFFNHSQPGAVGGGSPGSVHLTWIQNLVSGVKHLGLVELAPFTDHAYRAVLALPLCLAGLAWLSAIWKRTVHAHSSAITLAVTSGICLALVYFVPSSINGSSFFQERFAIFCSMFLAAAAAAASHPLRQWSRAAGVVAFCATGVLLPMQWANVSRIARELRPSLVAPTAKAGQVGLMIRADNPFFPKGLSFNPFLWSGAHYFRRSKAILANAPWTDLPIIMLRPVHPDRWSYLGPYPAERSLVRLMREGGTVADLSFVLAPGPSDRETEAVINDLRWDPLVQQQSFRIFARRP